MPSAVLPLSGNAFGDRKRKGRMSDRSLSVGAYGVFSVRRKIFGSTASVFSMSSTIASHEWRFAFAMIVSKFFFAAAASKGVPSLNVTPSRSVKVYAFPSSEIAHETARQGSIFPESPKLTSGS